MLFEQLLDAACQPELTFALYPAVCEFVYDIYAVRERFERASIASWCNTLDGVACGGFTETAAQERPGRSGAG